MNVQTYLFFDGRCEEALSLYGRVFGAETLFLMRFREGPAELVSTGSEEKIFHATLKIGETVLNLGDDLRRERGTLGGFALLVHVDSDEKAEQVFNDLAEEGQTELPLQTTFWASRYGIVTDRFGVTWKVQSG